MGDQKQLDVESQMETIPLYPQLTEGQQQLQGPRDDVDGNKITQADLDRIWKPVFEDYVHAKSVLTSGCCAPDLAMPVQYLHKLLSQLSEDDVDQTVLVRTSEPTQQRVQMLRFASAPRLSRRVVDLISTHGDQDEDGWISYQEFCNVILGQKDDVEMDHLNLPQRLINRAVQSVTPKSYDEYYTCCPPPLFIIIVSLVEVACYLYYCVTMEEFSFSGPTPLHSPLIYDPHRRWEAWRFLTYTFLHKGFIHIANNLVLQLVIGIPLEMAHGWWRVALVYLLGSTAGSLGHSVADRGIFLLGASGGVYALIGAHGANVILNWKEMRFGILRAILLGLYIIFDVSWAFYQRFGQGINTSVGYMAHLGGFVGGLFLGIVVLKNFRVYKWERVLFWLSLVVFLVLLVIAAIINLTNAVCKRSCCSDWTPLLEYIEKPGRVVRCSLP